MTAPAPRIDIKGGAGPYEVAAIVSAVLRVLAEEAAKAVRPPPPRPHPWVLAGRARAVEPALLGEATRAAVGWGVDPPQGDDDGRG